MYSIVIIVNNDGINFKVAKRVDLKCFYHK